MRAAYDSWRNGSVSGLDGMGNGAEIKETVDRKLLAIKPRLMSP